MEGENGADKNAQSQRQAGPPQGQGVKRSRHDEEEEGERPQGPATAPPPPQQQQQPPQAQAAVPSQHRGERKREAPSSSASKPKLSWASSLPSTAPVEGIHVKSDLQRQREAEKAEKAARREAAIASAKAAKAAEAAKKGGDKKKEEDDEEAVEVKPQEGKKVKIDPDINPVPPPAQQQERTAKVANTSRPSATIEPPQEPRQSILPPPALQTQAVNTFRPAAILQQTTGWQPPQGPQQSILPPFQPFLETQHSMTTTSIPQPHAPALPPTASFPPAPESFPQQHSQPLAPAEPEQAPPQQPTLMDIDVEPVTDEQRYQNELRRANAENQKLQAQATEDYNALAHRDTKIEELEKELRVLKLKVSNAETALETAHAEGDKAQAQRDEYKKQYEAAKEENKSIWKREQDRKKKEVEEAAERIQQKADSQIAAKDGELKKLQNQNEELKVQYAELQATVTGLHENTDELEESQQEQNDEQRDERSFDPGLEVPQPDHSEIDRLLDSFATNTTVADYDRLRRAGLRYTESETSLNSAGSRSWARNGRTLDSELSGSGHRFADSTDSEGEGSQLEDEDEGEEDLTQRNIEVPTGADIPPPDIKVPTDEETITIEIAPRENVMYLKKSDIPSDEDSIKLPRVPGGFYGSPPGSAQTSPTLAKVPSREIKRNKESQPAMPVDTKGQNKKPQTVSIGTQTSSAESTSKNPTPTPAPSNSALAPAPVSLAGGQSPPLLPPTITVISPDPQPDRGQWTPPTSSSWSQVLLYLLLAGMIALAAPGLLGLSTSPEQITRLDYMDYDIFVAMPWYVRASMWINELVGVDEVWLG